MKKKGFTLVELLVVIAIIGILATIVLVNLNAARNKAKDAAIKATLSEARVAGEMYYDDGGSGTYDDFCNSDDMGRIDDALESQYPTGAIACYDGGANCGTLDAWCASYELTDADTWWCVDSKGASGETLTTDPCDATLCDCD